MIRLSIFNEKGGVGKTTVTVLFASYLAYIHGKRVCVVDFDHPAHHIHQLRRDELSIREDPRSPLSCWMEKNPAASEPYEVLLPPVGTGGAYRPFEVFSFLSRLQALRYDYIFYDFPGRLAVGEPVSFLAANDYLDFVAVPMDTDAQSRQGALVVADALHRKNIPMALFWNRVSAPEAKGSGARFQRGAAPFLERGLPVMKEQVRDVRKLSRDSSEMAFLRSTLCFPTRYVEMRSPSLIPFLEALKHRTDNLL